MPFSWSQVLAPTFLYKVQVLKICSTVIFGLKQSKVLETTFTLEYSKVLETTFTMEYNKVLEYTKTLTAFNYINRPAEINKEVTLAEILTSIFNWTNPAITKDILQKAIPALILCNGLLRIIKTS